MATVKLSINLGQHAENVVVAAGAAIAGNDGLFVNVDRTTMTKGQALVLLDEVKKQIHQSSWPQL